MSHGGITNDDGLLLGIFEVNGVHNVIHLITGAVALWAGMSSAKNAKMYFQVFGVIYGLVAVLGIFDTDGPLLGIIAHNMADLMLHIVIAAAALYLGFGSKTMPAPAPVPTSSTM